MLYFKLYNKLTPLVKNDIKYVKDENVSKLVEKDVKDLKMLVDFYKSDLVNKKIVYDANETYNTLILMNENSI
jgi:hypothetical protein